MPLSSRGKAIFSRIWKVRSFKSKKIFCEFKYLKRHQFCLLPAAHLKWARTKQLPFSQIVTSLPCFWTGQCHFFFHKQSRFCLWTLPRCNLYLIWQERVFAQMYFSFYLAWHPALCPWLAEIILVSPPLVFSFVCS